MLVAALLLMIGSVASAHEMPGPYDFPVPTAEQFEEALEIYEQSFVARQLRAAVVDVHASTAELNDINVALAAGYAQSGECISYAEGAKGILFANAALIADPSLNPSRPELLMYEPQADGGLRFVGLTYLVSQQAWHEAGNREAPRLFRQEFYLNETLSDEPVYALHFWIGQFNPQGLFATLNPLVSCAAAGRD